MSKRAWSCIVSFVTLMTTACGDANPTAADEISIEPIQIERVDVSVLESFPPRAVADVRGVLGDGCSELHAIEQERFGNIVTVTITRQRPRDAICIQIARLFEENISLQGTYPAGRYVLRVNDVETSFTTQ